MSMKVLSNYHRMLKTVVCLGFFVSILSGCSSVPHYDVEVYPSAELTHQYGYMPSLEVDVAGVNKNEAGRVKSVNIDRYFTADNALRKSLKPETLRFSEDDVVYKVLSDDSERWNTWNDKGADSIALVVNLPVVEENPQEDGRKLIVPIIKEGIFSRNSGTLRFEITPAGIIQINRVPEVLSSASVEKAEPVHAETMNAPSNSENKK